jgi:hypothetical protein
MTGVSVRASFVERFGEANACALEAAAIEHKNGVHDEPGSDPFKWALCIAIGYECMGRFANYHGITCSEAEVQEWGRAHADLRTHDGDVDYIAVMAGSYDGWVSTDEAES